MAADDPGRLSISVTQADGRVIRWGPDEVDGKNNPADLSFSTSIPGGFQDMTCSLLRRIDQDYPDQALFDDVTVYGAGNRVAWQGRMQQFPRSHGSSYQITPGAVGWTAHLRDDASFSQVYVSRDLNWRGVSLTRRIALVNNATSWRVGDGTTTVDATSGIPAIVLSHSLEGGNARPIGEAWFDAGAGNKIALVAFDFQEAQTQGTDANWFTVIVASDDDGAAAESSSDFHDTASVSPTAQFGTYTPSTPRRFIAVQFGYATTAAASAGIQRTCAWRNMRLFGDHGLPIWGASSSADGHFASDVIAHIVTNAAPLLTYSTGTGGSIEATTFPIPHLTFPTPTSGEDAISTTNAYHLWDWGVYENREFFYRRPDPARMLWEARLGDGAFMDADGLTGEQVINGVFVTYTDAAGASRTVGPPGGAFENTDATLEDTSENNPATVHGLQRWTGITMSALTTLTGATAIGAAYLAERSLATRRGSMTLTGTIQHPTEGQVPVWRVRAGDWIRVADLNGENADVPRKIISTSYSHQSRSISLNLDNTVAKLDAILSRVGVQTGITTGGGF